MDRARKSSSTSVCTTVNASIQRRYRSGACSFGASRSSAVSATWSPPSISWSRSVTSVPLGSVRTSPLRSPYQSGQRKQIAAGPAAADAGTARQVADMRAPASSRVAQRSGRTAPRKGSGEVITAQDRQPGGPPPMSPPCHHFYGKHPVSTASCTVPSANVAARLGPVGPQWMPYLHAF